MKQATTHRLTEKDVTFEQANRQARWLTIVLVLLTFPPGAPQSRLVYELAALVIGYNLLRHWPAVMRFGWFASPITALVLDNALVVLFLYVIGTLSTPYSAFLIFMVITAAYRYGRRGLLAVVGAQMVFVAAMVEWPWGRPVVLDDVRTGVAAALVLLIVGLFVERLSRADRDERRALKELDSETTAERERLLTLINTLHDAILVIDAKSRVLLANGAAQELMARGDGWRGEALATALPLRPRTKPNAKPVSLLEAGQLAQHRRDLRLTRADGTTVDLDLSVTPVQLGEAGSSNYIVVGRDITKERSLDQQREEFIAVASHELKTPLAIVEVALSTAMLGKKDMTPQVVTLLDQAHRNTVFLATIVKDLTTLSEAQNDNLPIALKPVEAAQLLRQLVLDFEPQAKAKDLPLRVIVEAGTPAVLSTEHYIREVLQNYLNNAIKYTAKGHITVEAHPSENGGVRFSVSDTGVGIAAADQQLLFTKFYRAEDYRTRETGGTGLGLYLCLELAERINGRVWCESKVNEGSTFYLEVPPFSQLRQDHGKVVEAQVANLVDQL